MANLKQNNLLTDSGTERGNAPGTRPEAPPTARFQPLVDRVNQAAAGNMVGAQAAAGAAAGAGLLGKTGTKETERSGSGSGASGGGWSGGGWSDGGQAAAAAPAAEPAGSGIQAVPSGYEQAMARLREMEGQTPGYTSRYDQDIADAYDRIMGRGSFQYDLNADALYRQYADYYKAQGRAAMQDSMGQAAALTGGYGSTYGQAVGQQAYDRYLQELNAQVPELYDRAYRTWQDEGDRMLQGLSLLQQREAQDYNRYQDAYDRFLQERSWAQEQADKEYSRQGDNLAKLQTLMSLGYTPTDQEVADAGLTPAQFETLRAAMLPEVSAGNDGGGMDWYSRNSYYGYDAAKGLSRSEIRQLQEAMGMKSPDGVWGPRTQADWEAANGGGSGGSGGTSSGSKTGGKSTTKLKK